LIVLHGSSQRPDEFRSLGGIRDEVRIGFSANQGDAPVPVHPHRPVIHEFARKRVRPESRNVEILRPLDDVESRQDAAQSERVRSPRVFVVPGGNRRELWFLNLRAGSSTLPLANPSHDLGRRARR
jgi:hypothetical protein